MNRGVICELYQLSNNFLTIKLTSVTCCVMYRVWYFVCAANGTLELTKAFNTA